MQPSQAVAGQCSPASSAHSARVAADSGSAGRRRVVHIALVNNPLVAPALGMAGGIFLDAACGPPWWVMGLLFLAAGYLLWVGVSDGPRGRGPARRRARLRGPSFVSPGHIIAPLALAAAGLCVGAVLHDVSFRRWPADHISLECRGGPVAIHVAGTILSTAGTRPGRTGRAASYPTAIRARMLVEVDSVVLPAGSRPACGLVNVTLLEPGPDLLAGDRVRLAGRLERIPPPANSGGLDWALINRRNGILAQMTCRKAGDCEVLTPGASAWASRLDRIRRRARAAMLEETYAQEVPGSGLLATMVLGQRSAIDPALNEAFVRTGTVHYLSVSGAHVGMLVAAVFGLGTLVGTSRRRCAGWAMVAATGYALLAEAGAPIIRAAVMTDMACLDCLLRKPVRTANCLAASALVLLAWRPTQLFEAGFQLSYLTLLSVIYLSPEFHRGGSRLYRRAIGRDDPLLSPEVQERIGMRSRHWRRWDHVVRAVGWLIAVGLAASMVGGLLTAYHFHQVQPWGWLNTVLLMPLVWLVTVLGLAKTGLAAVAPWTAGILGWPLARLTDALVFLVMRLALLPGSGLATPAVPVGVVVSGVAVAALWAARQPLGLGARWARVAGVGWLALVVWTCGPDRHPGELRVWFLSVGNGSATLLQLPDGRAVLYDVGCFPPGDLDRVTVGPALAATGCRGVAAVVLSHANLDHYCGLADLLERRPVGTVITTPHFEHAAGAHSASRELADRLRRGGCPWQRAVRGDRISGMGEVSFEVLWPPATEIADSDTNDTSMVLRVSYAGRRILLCGDIEQSAIDGLLASADLNADLLVLPHHGSVTPSTAAFIRAVAPSCCIRSTARHETSAALQAALAGRPCLSTAGGEIAAIVSRKENGLRMVAAPFLSAGPILH